MDRTKVARKLAKMRADALAAWKSPRVKEIFGLPKILSHPLCLLGFHNFQVVEKIIAFGGGGNIEKAQCKRCGLTVTRQG